MSRDVNLGQTRSVSVFNTTYGTLGVRFARFWRSMRNYVSKNTRNYHVKAKVYGIISHRKKKYRASRGEMTVDNTSLLVALKQKPHPFDAGFGIVCESEERGEKRVVTFWWVERIRFKETWEK